MLVLLVWLMVFGVVGVLVWLMVFGVVGVICVVDGVWCGWCYLCG